MPKNDKSNNTGDKKSLDNKSSFKVSGDRIFITREYSFKEKDLKYLKTTKISIYCILALISIISLACIALSIWQIVAISALPISAIMIFASIATILTKIMILTVLTLATGFTAITAIILERERIKEDKEKNHLPQTRIDKHRPIYKPGLNYLSDRGDFIELAFSNLRIERKTHNLTSHIKVLKSLNNILTLASAIISAITLIFCIFLGVFLSAPMMALPAAAMFFTTIAILYYIGSWRNGLNNFLKSLKERNDNFLSVSSPECFGLSRISLDQCKDHQLKNLLGQCYDFVNTLGSILKKNNEEESCVANDNEDPYVVKYDHCIKLFKSLGSNCKDDEKARTWDFKIAEQNIDFIKNNIGALEHFYDQNKNNPGHAIPTLNTITSVSRIRSEVDRITYINLRDRL